MSLKEYEGSCLRINLYKSGRNDKEYDVFLEEGSWPEDDILVTLCDGGDPEMPLEEQLHSGGTVGKGENPNHRVVRVYR